MIIVENYKEGLVRSYSDAGFQIRQDGTGIVYDEAIDPANSGRTYTETENYIEGYEPAPEEDIYATLGRIMFGEEA